MQLFSHTCDCVLSLCTVYLHNNTIKKSLKISQWQSEAVIRRMDNAMATNKGQIYKQMTYRRICTQFTIMQYNKVREGTYIYIYIRLGVRIPLIMRRNQYNHNI